MAAAFHTTSQRCMRAASTSATSVPVGHPEFALFKSCEASYAPKREPATVLDACGEGVRATRRVVDGDAGLAIGARERISRRAGRCDAVAASPQTPFSRKMGRCKNGTQHTTALRCTGLLASAEKKSATFSTLYLPRPGVVSSNL